MSALIFLTLLSAILSAAFATWLIPLLHRRHAGQPIHEARPEHTAKAGTPTMGGVAILAAVVVSWLVATVVLGVVSSPSAWLVLGLSCAGGAVGFVDDLTKVRSGHNSGLSVLAKVAGLVVAGTTFAVAMVVLVPGSDTPILRLGSVVVVGSPVLAVGWVLSLVLATSNAVNVTDGLDGLAAGASATSFAAVAAMATLVGRRPGFGIAGCPTLAALAACYAGASLGFLRVNRHPAKAFMGDTGSLALGAGLAGLAAVTGTGVLLPLVGILFVVEAASVVILVVAHHAFGRRPFHAPIHHELQGRGLAEPDLVRRLWWLAASGAVGAIVVFRIG